MLAYNIYKIDGATEHVIRYSDGDRWGHIDLYLGKNSTLEIYDISCKSLVVECSPDVVSDVIATMSACSSEQDVMKAMDDLRRRLTPAPEVFDLTPYVSEC